MDLIDRQAAVAVIHSLYPSAPILRKNRELWKKKYEPYIEAEKALEQMPSAQQDIDEWCHDCKEYDKERHCCPRWNWVIRQTLKDAQPDIIHCGECKYYHDSDGCFFSTATTGADGFCHWAERKEGETDGRPD